MASKYQHSLALSNARFEQLSIQSRTVTWEIDANGCFTYVSSAIETLTGFSAEEMVGKRYFYDLHPEMGRPEFRHAAMLMLAQKEPFQNLVSPAQTKGGGIIWIETNGLPYLDDRGELLGYWGMGRDVTEVRKANQKIAESEARYRVIFEGADEGIVVADVETMSLVYANLRFCELLGYTRDEVVSLSVLDIHPPEIHEQVQLIFESRMVLGWHVKDKSNTNHPC